MDTSYARRARADSSRAPRFRRAQVAIGALLALLLAATVTTAVAAQQGRKAGSCRCEVTKRFERAYDELLKLAARERRASALKHLPWGVPVNAPGATNEHLLHQEHYVLNHDRDLLVPTWVAYRLTAKDLEAKRSRTQCFRSDPRLPLDATGTCFDYRGSGFDRGHMVPNADMKRNEAAMINTYMFTNMAPQTPNFNQQIWAHLEDRVRDWAMAYGEIYVVTGAIFDRDGDGQRDPDEDAPHTKAGSSVAVPTHFYKIIAFEVSDTEVELMCFVLKQSVLSPSKNARDGFLNDAMVDLDLIEKATGWATASAGTTTSTPMVPWKPRSTAIPGSTSPTTKPGGSWPRSVTSTPAPRSSLSATTPGSTALVAPATSTRSSLGTRMPTQLGLLPQMVCLKSASTTATTGVAMCRC